MKDKPNVVQLKKRTRREKFNLETALGRVDAYLARTPMRDLSQFDFDPDLELGNMNPQVADKSDQFLKVSPDYEEFVRLAAKFGPDNMPVEMDLADLVAHFDRPDCIFAMSPSEQALKHAAENLLASINAVSSGSMRATDLLLSPFKPRKLLIGTAAASATIASYRLIHEDLSCIPPTSGSEANDEFYPLLDEHGFKGA